jgi:prepilin-type N-terminal cleavage/methylation domain-containing protein
MNIFGKSKGFTRTLSLFLELKNKTKSLMSGVIYSIKSIFKYQNRSKRTKTNLVCGFTLVEIVVVIGIMGLLTALIYSSFDTSKAKSRDQKRVSDVSAIQLALEQYFQKYGVYPVALDDTKFKSFISVIPQGPNANEVYSYFPLTRTIGSSNCVSYQLWTKFELNNAFLDSKKNFNTLSSNLLPANSKALYYQCGGNTLTGINADNSTDPLAKLIYDVMP